MALIGSYSKSFQDNLRGQSPSLTDGLTLKDGTDRLSRNVSNYLLINVAHHPRRAKIFFKKKKLVIPSLGQPLAMNNYSQQDNLFSSF
jgi:hypothetical protein